MKIGDADVGLAQQKIMKLTFHRIFDVTVAVAICQSSK
jgi:hypothetical protein